jgi:hypothetical protein
MTERKALKVTYASGEIKEIVFSISRGDPCVLEVEEPGGQRLRAEASDLFECLVKIRSDLERDGAKVLCNGARLDAYPSRMAREMGGGRKIYLMRMGEKARPEDLVNTFDEAPIEKIGSVADQRDYFLRWLQSGQ